MPGNERGSRLLERRNGIWPPREKEFQLKGPRQWPWRWGIGLGFIGLACEIGSGDGVGVIEVSGTVVESGSESSFESSDCVVEEDGVAGRGTTVRVMTPSDVDAEAGSTEKEESVGVRGMRVSVAAASAVEGRAESDDRLEDDSDDGTTVKFAILVAVDVGTGSEGVGVVFDMTVLTAEVADIEVGLAVEEEIEDEEEEENNNEDVVSAESKVDVV